MGLVSFVSGPLFLRLSKEKTTITCIIRSFYVSGASNSETGPGQACKCQVSWLGLSMPPSPREAPRNATLPFRSFWGIRVKIQDQSFLSPLGGVSHLSLGGLPSPLMGVSNFPMEGVSFSP